MLQAPRAGPAVVPAVHRRHLNAGQRAVVALKVRELLQPAAREGSSRQGHRCQCTGSGVPIVDLATGAGSECAARRHHTSNQDMSTTVERVAALLVIRDQLSALN